MNDKRPNILWIMTDQQSANMMSCAGNPYLHTPNIDFLASRGIRYTNAYCTNPVCLPSRFSLFTGLYPSEVGIRSNNYKEEMTQETLPDYLLANGFGTLMKQAGYRTVYGGKEHLPAANAAELGFDYICEDDRGILSDTCAEFITNYHDERPYFMVASFINPHDICFMAISDNAVDEQDVYIRDHYPVENTTMRAAQAPPEGVSEEDFYTKVCPPLPDNYLPAGDEAEAISIMLSKRMFKRLARSNYTERDWRLHRYTYARLTELADRQIGKILDAVIQKGELDNTVIIFTSDHGDMDASHKLEHKTALYQECCKIPLIIKGISGCSGGKTCDGLVSNGLDLIPTVLDYAGAPVPPYLTGLSLRATAERQTDYVERQSLIVESEFGNMAVDKRHRLARYFAGARNEQFYDSATNPHEKFNQIDDRRFQADVERLRAILDAERPIG